MAAAWVSLALHHAQLAKENGAPINPPVVAAQAALESGYGQSQLARQANNYFGIKASANYDGPTITLPTKEWNGTRYIDTVAHWRVYPTMTACFEDYGRIIARLSWYQDAEDAADSAQDYLEGILVKRNELGDVVEPGWATSPTYRDKVWSIIEQYDLLASQEPEQELYGEVDYVRFNDPLIRRLWDAWRGEMNRRTLWRIRSLTRGDGTKLDLATQQKKGG